MSKMISKYFLYYLVFDFFRSVCCQNVFIDLKLENKLVAQNGLGWPPSIHVAKGNEVLMKLREKLNGQFTCTVHDPLGVKFNIKSPPHTKYQAWSDGCGVRVRNITLRDTGRWRLTASNSKSETITGWTEVYVLDEEIPTTAPPISLKDGETEAKVELSPLENSYCVVARPFSESSLVPGRCSVTLDRTTRAVQGNWQIYLGLPGRVAELQANRHVTVQTERLDVGYVKDNSNKKMHLYCNILHTTKDIIFCRFQRTTSNYGYNVVDGLSDGVHSYYGKGFDLKQCGMTIERPTAQDFGTWRCSVGVQMLVGNEIVPQTPMQALISIAPTNLARSKRSEDEIRTIFVEEDSPFTITCSSKVSLSYCWFQHPNGSQFSPVRLVNEEQLFWYTGESLEVGDCGITFAHATSDDDGKWACHMGPRQSLDVEISDSVQVRVTGPLAANQKVMPVIIGENVTLYCHTANSRRPLSYCRFLSPNFVGMNIDSSVTSDNAILNRFYFTPGRDLNAGDCSLSILSVQEEDIGNWTCGAVVDDEISESRDTIRLYIQESYYNNNTFQAGIIGMSVGLSVLVVIFIGYVSYKREWIQWRWPIWKRANNTSNSSVVDAFSLQNISISSGNISSSSGSSFSTDQTHFAQSHS